MVEPVRTRNILTAGIAVLGLLASAFAIQINIGQRQQIRTLNAEIARLTLESEQLERRLSQDDVEALARSEAERFRAKVREISRQVRTREDQQLLPRVPSGPMPLLP
jgi:hypothetical protein